MKVKITKCSNPKKWYYYEMGHVYEVEEGLIDYYDIKEDCLNTPGCVRVIKKSDCEIIKEVEVNEKHEKYCKHSKFANKLCGKRRCTCQNNVTGCGVNADYTQLTDGWETCAIPSQQVEVIEKDMLDEIVDKYYNMDGMVFKKAARAVAIEYVKRLEAEKKPCEQCVPYHDSGYNYCSDCGRKL